MAQLQLKHIPLADLHVSKLNMRYGRKKPDVSDILPSIRKDGIRQTLLVSEERGRYGIVAGRRRFFALKQIAKKTGKQVKVPCAVMAAGDDASALEATLIENIGRLPATEVEQFRCFKAIHDKGRDACDIAEHFGVTELLVRRVLALAGLNPDILKLYERDELDRETIRALTLGSAEQQLEWLKLYQSEDERAPRGRQCKAWITGGTAITTDKALFELVDYDGEIIADLFGENGVFADPDTFWNHQARAIAAQIETYREKGWRDVAVLERGAYFAAWEHEKRARTKGGMVFAEIRHDGSVTYHEGYVSRAEARKLDKAETGGDDNETKTIKPELSGPLVEYIGLHRHGAACALLLGHPGIALRLMLANIMGGTPLYDVRKHGIVARKDATETSIANSKASTDLKAAHDAVAEMLAAHGVKLQTKAIGDEYRVCQLFAAFLGMDDHEVLQILTYTMATTLMSGGSIVEATLAACETDLANYWQPDEALFDLIRDKRLTNALLADIAGDSVAASMLTDTTKVHKQAIANRIIGEGCEPNPDWRPAFMKVPPERCVKNAPSAPADAWRKIAALFSPSEMPVIEVQDAA